MNTEFRLFTKNDYFLEILIIKTKLCILYVRFVLLIVSDLQLALGGRFFI